MEFEGNRIYKCTNCNILFVPAKYEQTKICNVCEHFDTLENQVEYVEDD